MNHCNQYLNFFSFPTISLYKQARGVLYNFWEYQDHFEDIFGPLLGHVWPLGLNNWTICELRARKL